MISRATQSLAFGSARSNVQKAFTRLYKSQMQVSTGKAILRPSDAPGSIARLLFHKERLGEMKQFSANATEAQSLVDSEAAALQEISDLIISARESTLQGLNGTLSQGDRDAIAETIDGLLQQVLALANTRFGSRFLFGGTETGQPPFVLSQDGSGQETITYEGNGGIIRSDVAPGLSTATNIPGSDVFLSSIRGDTTFLGATGIIAGLGSDSGMGVDHLLVEHTQTTYLSGGLAPGASSSGGDTVIGQLGTHTVTLTTDATGATGTVSLNGGPTVPFTNPQTDLQVTGPNGEMIYLDTSGVGANFNGLVDLTASGTLSIDGGATTVPINFSTNQQLIDSFNGGVLNVDTTGVSAAGDETVNFSETHSLFSTLIGIRDGLRGINDAGDQKGLLDLVGSHLEDLGTGHDRLLNSLGALGSLSSQLGAAGGRVQELGDRLAEVISNKEDVDFAAAVIDMQQSEAAYQSALLVTSRIGEMSLLNYF